MKLSLRLVSLSLLATALNLLAAPDSRFYVKVDGGGSLMQDVDFKNVPGAKLKFDPGVRFDVELGYQFTESLALELESGMTYNAIDKVTIPAGSTGILQPTEHDVNFYQVPIMANVIYRFPLQSKFKPFVGVGAGGVVSIVEAWREGWIFDNREEENQFTFGYQGMAGVGYAITDQIEVGIAYKFLGTLDHEFDSFQTEETYNHSFLAQFTFRF